jgi:hypothetical protein
MRRDIVCIIVLSLIVAAIGALIHRENMQRKEITDLRSQIIFLTNRVFSLSEYQGYATTTSDKGEHIYFGDSIIHSNKSVDWSVVPCYGKGCPKEPK